MKMVRYKQILAAACVFAALGASNVAAAETTLNENDLVIDKTVTVIGDQVLPDSEVLAMDETIKRINELYHKSKKEGLSEEEKQEQKKVT